MFTWMFEVSFEVPSMNKLNFAFEYFVMGIEQKRNYEVSTETPFFHSVKKSASVSFGKL